MNTGEWIGLGMLAIATISALLALVGALWKWAKVVEDRAYERARNEALLREAQATIAQKDIELATFRAKVSTALPVTGPEATS